MTEIFGTTAPGFEGLRDQLARQITEGLDIGARVSVCIEGEVVADLWGGAADRSGARPFTDNTLTPVFSTGKAVMALLVAAAVDRGQLDYERAVAADLPDFAAAGKAGVTLGQLISHQAGLPGFVPAQTPEIWFDPDAVVAALCAQAPLWPLGEGSGYHPITGGYLINALYTKATGRSLGTALAEDFAAPFGLELYIGTPDSEAERIAALQKPTAPPSLGEIDAIKRAAFFDRGSAPGGRGSGPWRRMEIPSANLHADARSLARLLNIVAHGGKLGQTEVLSPSALAQATRERIVGQDKVLPFRLSWAAGFLRNAGLGVYGPGARTVGHSGWGGSCVLADPDKRLSMAYVMTKQSTHLIGDPRAQALIAAAYQGL